MEDAQPSSRWLRITFVVTLIIGTIAGNLLVIISILKVKVLRRPHNHLILSLAVADLLVGCLVLPLRVVVAENSHSLYPGHFICYAWISAYHVCCSASVFSFTGVALDRYLAVVHPLYYRTNVTRKKISSLILIFWISSFLATAGDWLLHPVPSNLQELSVQTGLYLACTSPQQPWFPAVNVFGGFFLPLCLTLLMYGKICCVLRDVQTRNVTRKPVPTSTPGITTASLPAANDDTHRTQPCSEKICETLQEKKGIIMMATVIGVFVFCWVPSGLTWLTNAIATSIGKPLTIPMWIHDTIFTMSYFNSCLNPLIYAMFSRDFRFAFMEIIRLRGFTVNAKIKTRVYSQQMGTSAADV